jgi:hypothetical protein
MEGLYRPPLHLSARLTASPASRREGLAVWDVTNRPPPADLVPWDSEAVAPDTPPTAALDRYLAETNRLERQAEASMTGDASGWAKYLTSMPDGVSVRPSDGVLTRADLFALAEVDRDEQSDRSALDLFWNTMAWGIAGTWRNIPGLSTYVAANTEQVTTALRRAQQLSYGGHVQEAYRALNGAIKHLGPAFFTKFLYFTADRGQPVHALILDERVRVAWRILTGENLRSGYSQDYARFCESAGSSGGRIGLAPDEVEACLYNLGRKVGSYTAWLEMSLSVCRDRLGAQAPSIRDVIDRPGK